MIQFHAENVKREAGFIQLSIGLRIVVNINRSLTNYLIEMLVMINYT